MVSSPILYQHTLQNLYLRYLGHDEESELMVKTFLNILVAAPDLTLPSNSTSSTSLESQVSFPEGQSDPENPLERVLRVA